LENFQTKLIFSLSEVKPNDKEYRVHKPFSYVGHISEWAVNNIEYYLAAAIKMGL
jgi:hypothetical protein